MKSSCTNRPADPNRNVGLATPWIVRPLFEWQTQPGCLKPGIQGAYQSAFLRCSPQADAFALLYQSNVAPGYRSAKDRLLISASGFAGLCLGPGHEAIIAALALLGSPSPFNQFPYPVLV
ncbi:hypothetical protein EWB00_000655 [Schistosoma japonicum]|uniref:Uncharacterized protein n=1 Tax=Schistosoma japonicum TaxID=6182 RepID=A0A4Z2CK62_SCHJA|nr:hypothetical protein EWB00_000655 [Schistosoma japonicum]